MVFEFLDILATYNLVASDWQLYKGTEPNC